MATIEEGLYAALADTGGRIYGLVEDRIYPAVIPQEADLPAMAYQRVSANRTPGHGGTVGLAEGRIQVTISADEYRTAKAVAEAMREIFPFRGILGGLVQVYAGWVENEVDGYGPQIEAPTVRLDLWFMYAE